MVTFVYRSHYEGPLSKRVQRLAAPSVLAWFAERIDRARAGASDDEIIAALEAELGCQPYGLSSLFREARDHAPAAPTTMAELDALLQAHLYCEGEIVVGDHAVRVLTDDDEVALAYFFFDDAALTANPAALAWLLHDEPRLPEASPGAPFVAPADIDELLPFRRSEGATYVCLFTFTDSDSLPGSVHVFRGVRLPKLVLHLRDAVPVSKPSRWSPRHRNLWPFEIRALRALIGPDDTTLAPALARANAAPLAAIYDADSDLGTGSQPAAHRAFAKAAAGLALDGDPARSVIDIHDHAILFARHTTRAFGHQQWILFDDVWAAANPDLAASLLRYGRTWDPLGAP